MNDTHSQPLTLPGPAISCSFILNCTTLHCTTLHHTNINQLHSVDTITVQLCCQQQWCKSRQLTVISSCYCSADGHCISVKLFIAHCTLQPAHWPLYCTLNTAHYTLHTDHCTLHTEYCTLHTAHFLHTSWATTCYKLLQSIDILEDRFGNNFLLYFF